MTTIAFDGETLAADRCHTLMGVTHDMTKLHVSGEGWAMAAAFDGPKMVEGIERLKSMRLADILSERHEGLASIGDDHAAAVMLVTSSGEVYCSLEGVFTKMPRQKTLDRSGGAVSGPHKLGKLVVGRWYLRRDGSIVEITESNGPKPNYRTTYTLSDNHEVDFNGRFNGKKEHPLDLMWPVRPPHKAVGYNGVAAIGSGAHFALGAMVAGATAIEAVTIASRLDKSSGFGVDSVTVTDLRGMASDYSRGAAL